MSGPQAPRDAGFALVELLASLAVLGLLGLLIAAGLAPGRRAWARMEARREALDTVAAAQGVLRERISHLIPLARLGSSNTSTEVVGEANALAFVGPGSKADGPSEARHYTLRLASTGEVVLESVSDLAPSPVPDRREVVLGGAQGLDIAYFGVGAPDNTARWRERWDGPPTAPALIRVRVAFGPADSRVWPELLIRPYAVTDTGCVIDLRNGLCKGRS